MAKYKVYMPKVIWANIPVEADDEEAAITAAHEIAPNLCAHCTGWGSKEWSVDEDEWGGISDLHENFKIMVEKDEE